MFTETELLIKRLQGSQSSFVRIINALELNAAKDRDLNQRIIIAMRLNQNRRPLFFQARAILLERARLFDELVTATKSAADFCNSAKDQIAQMIKTGDVI